LEIDYQKNLAIFKNNVQVDNEGTTINADIMDVYFSRSTNEAKEKEEKEEGAQKGAPPSLAGSKIEKVIARGNVKITKGQNVSYSDEATYVAIDKKVILTGRPKLMIYSTEDFKGVF
jgi:lipopolysaccharide export system protein LptA